MSKGGGRGWRNRWYYSHTQLSYACMLYSIITKALQHHPINWSTIGRMVQRLTTVNRCSSSALPPAPINEVGGCGGGGCKGAGVRSPVPRTFCIFVARLIFINSFYKFCSFAIFSRPPAKNCRDTWITLVFLWFSNARTSAFVSASLLYGSHITLSEICVAGSIVCTGN